MATITLDQLPELYREARAAAAMTARYTASNTPPNTCRYCGKFRQSWHASKIDGHAKCIVPVEFMRTVLALYRRDPTLSRKSLGEALGVSESVVVGWMRAAERSLAAETRRIHPLLAPRQMSPEAVRDLVRRARENEDTAYAQGLEHAAQTRKARSA